MEKFEEWVYNTHDIICNQKYGDNLPYSFHLKAVQVQGKKYLNLIKGLLDKAIVKHALVGHDLLEDARVSYNDVTKKVRLLKRGCYRSITYKDLEVLVADVIYCVTDEKGKNRKERKNDKYYKELSENKLAVFVKLADIAANTLYSKLTDPSRYNNIKKEWPYFKEKCYVEEYKEFFNYVENL